MQAPVESFVNLSQVWVRVEALRTLSVIMLLVSSGQSLLADR
jgi:hypothetical protein